MKSKIAIYHMTTAAFRQGLDTAGYERDEAVREQMIRKGITEDRYVFCARVEADSLSQAWELTNHLEGPWNQGEAVVFSAGDSQRSSMVGDIFWFEGEAHIVGGIGFKKLSPELTALLVENAKPGTAFSDSL